LILEVTLGPAEERPGGPGHNRSPSATWGRGTLKIARLMREAGLDPPVATLLPGAVVLTFTLPEAATGKTTGKTHEVVLALLAGEPSLSVPEIAQRIGKGPRATERMIRTLREAGKLSRIGPAKGGYWKVIE